MATTAKDLVMAARAHLDLVSPQDASAEAASGRSLFVDVRQNEEWQHGVALLEGGQEAWQAAGLPIVEHEFAGI